MEEHELLHRTVTHQGDYLTVSIAATTYSERHTEDEREWWYVYFVMETWIGFMPECVMKSQPVYMMAKYEGINQEIKLELPSLDAVNSIAEHYHGLAVLTAQSGEKFLMAQAFATLAQSLQ